jgi:hypothetical protein
MKNKVSRYVSIYLLCLAFSLLSALTSSGQSNAQKNAPIEYQIFGVWKPGYKGGSLAFVSVNPPHFNREDMLLLAQELKQQFKLKRQIRVLLFDDPLWAEAYAKGKAEPRDVDLYVKGVFIGINLSPKNISSFLRKRISLEMR